MRNYGDIIIRPIISEMSMVLASEKKYVFEVATDATKPEIATAVEEAFKVSVASVNTINCKRKPKRMGVHSGYTAAWKKAVVTLTEKSNTIEFFDSMM